MNDQGFHFDPKMDLPQTGRTGQHHRLVTAAWMFGWIGLISMVCGAYVPFAVAVCSAAATVMWADFERSPQQADEHRWADAMASLDDR
jgi:hypothetical protein